MEKIIISILNRNASIIEMNLTVNYSFQSSDQSDHGWHAILYIVYIAQASYRDYVRQEVQPAILARESNMQLIIYSLNKCVRYSMYLPPIKSQKGSIEALNFLMKCTV